jgi:hypothetical protein
MYARKYGDTLPEKIFAYGQGVVGQASRLPGLREVSDLYEGISKAVKEENMMDTAGGLTNEAIGYIRARTIPAIVNDFAQGIDPSQRSTDGELSKIKSSIPGLRQTLPAKIDQTSGKPMESEGFVSTLLFGSRLKTANQNKIVNEINRLYDEGTGPTISSIEYASSRVKDFKTQVSDEKFQEALEYYGTKFSEKVNKIMAGGSYKMQTDDKKKDRINNARTEAMDAMLKNYHYKKTKD